MQPMPPQDPQAQPQPPQQGPSPVEQILSKTHEGLMQLAEVFQKAGHALPPEDTQKLGAIITAFQALVEDLSGNGQKDEPAPGPQGPMDPNAGPDSKPL